MMAYLLHNGAATYYSMQGKKHLSESDYASLYGLYGDSML